MSDFFDRLLDIGGSALETAANRAVLGRDEATAIRMAQETDYYAGLTGAGPADRQGALRDTAQGNPYWRNPFSGGGVPGADGSGQGWIMLAVVALVVLLVWKKA